MAGTTHRNSKSSRFLVAITVIALAACVVLTLGLQVAIAEEAGLLTVSAVTPNSAPNSGNIAVTVSGSGFEPGCAVELELNGSKVPATSVTVADATTINGTVDLTGAAAGAWNVKVTGPDGHSAQLAGGFTVTGPVGNDRIEPNDTIAQAYGPLTQGVAFPSYISREDDIDFFKLTVPTGGVRLTATMTSIPYGCDFDLALFNASGQKVGASGNGGDTNETIEVAGVAAGQYFIQVNGWQGYSLDDSYIVSYAIANPPAIRALSPAGGVPGATVTISGSGFGKIKDGSYVWFGSVQCANNLYLSWSDTKVVVRVPAGVGGKVPVSVMLGSGQKANGAIFKVVPRIDSLGASRGRAGSVLAISGQGFGAWTARVTSVYFGRVKASYYQSWSNYTIKVKVPGGVSGSVPVKVVTAGGTSATRTFTVTR